MATGSMAEKESVNGAPHFILAALGCLSAGAVGAVDVGLAGVTSTKALLLIDGGEPRSVAVGQSVGGVRLISVQGDQAVIEIDGRKRPLQVGQHAVGTGGGDSGGKVVLTADAQGHFYTTGTINGNSVKFLVDTGATMVSLGAADARRLGLDPARGQAGISNTANGQAQVSHVKLDSVRVGDITLYNVDALIHQNDMPFALLGMSFLNRMEMQRDGGTMTLKKRF